MPTDGRARLHRRRAWPGQGKDRVRLAGGRPTIGVLIRDRVGNDVFGTNSFYVAPIEDAYEPAMT